MAKRKRLTPPAPDAAPETKSGIPSYPMGIAPGPAPRRAPIADVAGAAAAEAALSELSAEMEAAREEGRMVLALPLEAIDRGHLVRDRLTAAVDEDEMRSLMQSLAARGQQTPIEVTRIAQGRYGLISGWRRLTALERLLAETGEERFASVQALVRRPETAADAYVAMVEENEIRVGLSYFERARIVDRAVAEGVCESDKQALNRLFVSSSRAKRSKIKSFLPLVRELGEVLRFPTAIGERLGLKLSAAIETDGAGPALRRALEKAAPGTAEAELAALQAALEAEGQTPEEPAPDPGSAAVEGPEREEIAPGLWLECGPRGLRLSGPGLTDEVITRLRAVLTAGAASG